MAYHVLRKLIHHSRSNVSQNMLPRLYSIYEPDYLEALQSKYPLYPPLTVQIKGYDYPILESYQSWIHKIANEMEFDVENSYAMPAKQLKIVRFKPKSTAVEIEYFLNIYERDLKICNVSSVRLPIFTRVIEAALPPGVTLNIEEWSAEKENYRYIPDKHLLDMKAELEKMTVDKVKK